jgi:uncharacterized protein YceK
MKTSPPLTALALAGLLLAGCATVAPAVAPCQSYCATQDDGYQWAQRSNLYDAAPCAGYTAAFTAGCRQAVVDAQLSRNPRSNY